MAYSGFAVPPVCVRHNSDLTYCETVVQERTSFGLGVNLEFMEEFFSVSY